MTDMVPCSSCGALVATRTAPSGTVRLVRHDYRDRARAGSSCAGTGQAVVPA